MVFESMSYDEKLIRALWHFEPETAVRAAEILAMRKVKKGALGIADAYAARADLDPMMARTFVKAIAEITGESEAEVAGQLRWKNNFASETAAKIVESIAGA
jgi:hypothetical protein